MLAEKKIRKHVTMIHAYSLMSVLQRKIVNFLLYEAIKGNNRLNNQNSVAVECKIPFSNLCKAVKFNSNNTHYLKEAIDGLASIKIEWNLLKDKVPTEISFLNLRILHGSPTFYQDNTINFSFHKMMLDLVENPSIYGTLDIDLQADFESKYSHALYENSTRFVNLQRNKVIQLEAFRKILGVQDNIYPNMRELTRNVIAPSIEEVNDRADFVVTLNKVSSGRKIIGFDVIVNNKIKTDVSRKIGDNLENVKIEAEIKQTFGSINESVLENILKSYSEEYLLEKIVYTRKHAKKEKTGYYPIPYFISAIKHDYKKKEEFQSKEKAETLSHNIDEEWNKKLHSLQSDLKHFERIFEYTKRSNNESQTKNAENVINTCKDKIQKHYLEQALQKKVN
jgi:plasmid replication initiation protein